MNKKPFVPIIEAFYALLFELKCDGRMLSLHANMGFYKKIKYFLVHTLMLSNKQAQQVIESGQVEIAGKKITQNCPLPAGAEIKINGRIAREKKEFVYLKFHKPRGFESTLNTAIEENLAVFFEDYQGLAIAGRLDKQSEGLLLLSNDGKWVENMCNPKFEKEKEYLVTLNSIPSQAFIDAFKNGVGIGRYTTKPCRCEHVNACVIRVVLREGKNRQIRRMCKALNHQVIKLERVRIENILLENLKPGEKTRIKF